MKFNVFNFFSKQVLRKAEKYLHWERKKFCRIVPFIEMINDVVESRIFAVSSPYSAQQNQFISRMMS